MAPPSGRRGQPGQREPDVPPRRRGHLRLWVPSVRIISHRHRQRPQEAQQQQLGGDVEPGRREQLAVLPHGRTPVSPAWSSPAGTFDGSYDAHSGSPGADDPSNSMSSGAPGVVEIQPAGPPVLPGGVDGHHGVSGRPVVRPRSDRGGMDEGARVVHLVGGQRDPEVARAPVGCQGALTHGLLPLCLLIFPWLAAAAAAPNLLAPSHPDAPSPNPPLRAARHRSAPRRISSCRSSGTCRRSSPR